MTGQPYESFGGQRPGAQLPNLHLACPPERVQQSWYFLTVGPKSIVLHTLPSFIWYPLPRIQQDASYLGLKHAHMPEKWLGLGSSADTTPMAETTIKAMEAKERCMMKTWQLLAVVMVAFFFMAVEGWCLGGDSQDLSCIFYSFPTLS